jgi:hypothetical protein
VIAEFSSLVIFLYSAGRGSREESGNFCAADIPETSAFIAFGPNQGFDDPRCSEAGEGGLGLCVSKLVAGSGCTCEPDGEDFIVECGNDSGGKALSYHAISVLGLIAVAAFW